MATGTWLHTMVGRPLPAGAPRWPETGLFAVDGWSAGPVGVQEAWGVHHLRRVYSRLDGVTATVILSTNTRGKGVYGDAGIPLAGKGYEVDAAPAALVAPAAGRRAVLARGEGRVWLMLYGYGESRGLLGNGLRAWGAVLADAALGRPNNYFQLRVLVPFDEVAPQLAADATVELGDTLMARLAAWYRV